MSDARYFQSVVCPIFPLAEAATHQPMEAGDFFGKIIVQP
jgi:hypothetical protein